MVRRPSREAGATIPRASTGISGLDDILGGGLPTNHLYLGDIVVCERGRASFPDLSVEDGIRIFLTGGMALPPRLDATAKDDGAGGFRV